MAVLFTVSISFAQVKKPVSIKGKAVSAGTAAPPAKMDTLLIKYVKQLDTAKVRIVAFGDDNTIIWLNGYALKTYGVFGPNDVREITDPVYVDAKYSPIRKEDILNVILLKWN